MKKTPCILKIICKCPESKYYICRWLHNEDEMAVEKLSQGIRYCFNLYLVQLFRIPLVFLLSGSLPVQGFCCRCRKVGDNHQGKVTVIADLCGDVYTYKDFYHYVIISFLNTGGLYVL